MSFLVWPVEPIENWTAFDPFDKSRPDFSRNMNTAPAYRDGGLSNGRLSRRVAA